MMLLKRVLVAGAALLLLSTSEVLAQSCDVPAPRVKIKSRVRAVHYVIDPWFNNDGAHYDFPIYASRQPIIDGFKKWEGKKGITVNPQPPPANIRVIKWDIDYPFPQINFIGFQSGGEITDANLQVPRNWAPLIGFTDSRTRKAFAHELGHLFGLDEFNNDPRSVMKQADANAPFGDLDNRVEEPSCGDEEGLDNAWRMVGSPAEYIGPIGGVGRCLMDDGFYTDSPECCHGANLTYVPALGEYNRKPIVAIEAPSNNATFGPGSNISFSLHTLDLDGRVWRVDWSYTPVGGTTVNLAPTYSPPFGLTAQNVPPGDYDVVAVGYDTADQYTISNTVRVKVLPPPSGPSVLVSGAVLYPNQARTSPNGQYSLWYQSDGNLVLYGPSGAMVWTGTPGPAGGAYMNPNGNLEVYNSYQQLLWSSNTASAANAGAHVRVQDSGQVAVVRPNGTVVAQWP